MSIQCRAPLPTCIRCAESDKGDTKVESKADGMVDQNQANAEAIGEASVPPTESVEDVSTPAESAAGGQGLISVKVIYSSGAYWVPTNMRWLCDE